MNNKMKNLINFSDCPMSGLVYAGSEEKIGIIYNNHNCILKFPKIVNGEESLGFISEYLGSQIFNQLGIPVHETLLGTYKSTYVVCLRDFTDFKYLVEFKGVGESSLDSSNDAENHLYEYTEIEEMILSNKKLADKSSAITRFWRMFVVDAVLGNFDRHGYNWGYLRDHKNNYELAPVYDNGACLFPRLKENEIDKILNNEEELKLRTFTFPTSQIKLNGKKSSYYQVISSKAFDGCNEAILWLRSMMDLNSINAIIDDMPVVSDKRKKFYKEIIKFRYVHIIENIDVEDVKRRRE